MKVELLAPAGSFEAFEAALSAGADAVYVGGSRFGARAYAENLDQEQMWKKTVYDGEYTPEGQGAGGTV